MTIVLSTRVLTMAYEHWHYRQEDSTDTSSVSGHVIKMNGLRATF